MRGTLTAFIVAVVAFAQGGSIPASMPAPPITLYTHTACPFAQRVWVALEASGLDYKLVDVNLYGRGGFDKSQLKKVEAAGGLSPKGYIPVMSIGDEVIRESSVCVQRVATLSTQCSGAVSLSPQEPDAAAELIDACNALPETPRSRELTDLIQRADRQCATSSFLAGETLSIADCCLLPFLQRVEEDITDETKHLRAYMRRAHQLPAFSKTVQTAHFTASFASHRSHSHDTCTCALSCVDARPCVCTVWPRPPMQNKWQVVSSWWWWW